jgi:hypothetical protein
MSKIGLRAPGISLNDAYIRLAQAVGDLAGEGDVDRLTFSQVTRLTRRGRRNGCAPPGGDPASPCRSSFRVDLVRSSPHLQDRPATCERFGPHPTAKAAPVKVAPPSLMAAAGIPDHIRVAWCRHTVAVNVADYTHARAEDLTVARDALSGIFRAG